MQNDFTGMPAPPKRRESILKFGRSEPQPADSGGITSDMNALSRRLKLLEEGFSNLRRFFQVTEGNILAKNKHYSAEIKTINSDIMELRKELAEIRDKMMLVIRELQTVARRDEVKVLEKYINLWNPVKFVSHNEVQAIVQEILDSKRSDVLKEKQQ